VTPWILWEIWQGEVDFVSAGFSTEQRDEDWFVEKDFSEAGLC